MEKQKIDLKFPTKISQKIIYDIYCDNFDSLINFVDTAQYTLIQKRVMQDLKLHLI